MSEIIEAIEHLESTIVLSALIIFLGLVAISLDLTLIRRSLKK